MKWYVGKKNLIYTIKNSKYHWVVEDMQTPNNVSHDHQKDVSNRHAY